MVDDIEVSGSMESSMAWEHTLLLMDLSGKENGEMGKESDGLEMIALLIRLETKF